MPASSVISCSVATRESTSRCDLDSDIAGDNIDGIDQSLSVIAGHHRHGQARPAESRVAVHRDNGCHFGVTVAGAVALQMAGDVRVGSVAVAVREPQGQPARLAQVVNGLHLPGERPLERLVRPVLLIAFGADRGARLGRLVLRCRCRQSMGDCSCIWG